MKKITQSILETYIKIYIYSKSGTANRASLLDEMVQLIVHLLPTNKPLSMSMPAGIFFASHCTRVGVAWDTYRNDSIKAATREKRGKEMRRKVSGSNNKVPGNRRDFLQAKVVWISLTEKCSFDYPKDFFTSDVNVLAKGSSHGGTM